MKIFGYDLTWNKSAPRIPKDEAAGRDLANILPPFSTNPPGPPVTVNGNVEIRDIRAEPREQWYLSLPVKISPQQIQQILRSALGGDLWQQYTLCLLLLDNWPMFRKCSHELRQSVSQTKFKVNAFAVDGEEPTQSASDKAALVRRAIAGMKPNAFNDEEDLTGGIYDFCDSVLNGIAVTEIIWQKPQKVKGFGMERYPQGLTFVHPRHYSFTNDGNIAVFPDNYAREYYNLAQVPSVTPDPRKFICSQFKSKSGSSLAGGLMRPLAYDYAAIIWNREWLLKSAQTFGSPFVDVTYKPGISQVDLARLDAEIQSGLANRFIRHVEGTVVNVTPSRNAGANNSQRELMELADKHCLELFLGQAGTTQSTPGQLGGKDDSKENVKREYVEGIAAWVAKEPLQQLVRAILLVNYGEDSECPTIECDFTEQESPLEAAQRMQILSMPNMPPMVADDYYTALKIAKPEPGDQVILAGKVGILGDTEQEIDPNPQPVLSPHYDSQGNSMYPPDSGEETEEDDEAEPVQASWRGTNLKTLLGDASTEDLNEIESLVYAAEQAPHLNGEVALLKAKLKKLKGKKH